MTITVDNHHTHDVHEPQHDDDPVIVETPEEPTPWEPDFIPVPQAFLVGRAEPGPPAGLLVESVESPPPPGELEGTTRVTETAVEHFDDWDANGDGRLGKDELEAAMADPTYTDEAAATLVALYRAFDDLKKASNDQWGAETGISRNDLAALEAAQAAERDIGFAHYWYDDALATIDGTIDDVFGPGGPDGLALTQGGYGNCFFHAGLAGLAESRPDVIIDMIEENEDGTYTVTFPDGEPITIDAPTDAEIAMGGGAGANGLWVAILEKAYLEDRGWASELGTAGTGVSYVTGNSSSFHVVPWMSEDALVENLEETLADGGVIVAGIGGGPFGTDEIPDQHAYTVLGYDAETGLITLRNPWGRAETTDDDGQPLDGVDDGVFTVTVEEFKELFDTVAFENVPDEE